MNFIPRRKSTERKMSEALIPQKCDQVMNTIVRPNSVGLLYAHSKCVRCANAKTFDEHRIMLKKLQSKVFGCFHYYTVRLVL